MHPICTVEMVRFQGHSSHGSHSLLLLNGLDKDKEVIAPLFKIRRLGLGILETSYFLGQSSLIADWEIKGRFRKRVVLTNGTYPRSGFRSGGTSAETTLLETALLSTPKRIIGR